MKKEAFKESLISIPDYLTGDSQEGHYLMFGLLYPQEQKSLKR